MQINPLLPFRTESVLCSIPVQPVYGVMVLCPLGQATVKVFRLYLLPLVLAGHNSAQKHRGLKQEKYGSSEGLLILTLRTNCEN